MQLPQNQKLVFLEKFVGEIINQKKQELKEKLAQEQREKQTKENINIEKLKQKLQKPIFHIDETIPKRKFFLKKPIHQLKHPMLKPPLQLKPLQPIQQKPGQNPLQKLAQFIKDNSIISIECPGPNKSLLVKKAGQTNQTHTVLSEKEIKEIIDYFSQNSKIPLIGGLLKAAVGNLIISAVISDFVGSRFIIQKKTPYSLIA